MASISWVEVLEFYTIYSAKSSNYQSFDNRLEDEPQVSWDPDSPKFDKKAKVRTLLRGSKNNWNFILVMLKRKKLKKL